MTPTYDSRDGSPLSPTTAWFGDSPLSEGNPSILAVSQPISSPDILVKLYKPQSLLDKAKINQGWDEFCFETMCFDELERSSVASNNM